MASVHLEQITADPITNALVSSERVSQNEFDNNWTVDFPVEGALSGAVEFAGSSSSILLGENHEHYYGVMFREGDTEFGLDPAVQAKPRAERVKIGLLSFRAALEVGLDEMRHAVHPGIKGDLLRRIYEGWPKHIAHMRAIGHYATTYGTDNNPGVIGRLPDAASATGIVYAGPIDASGSPFDGDYTSGDNAFIIQFVTPEGASNRYARGMQVDIHKSATPGTASADPSSTVKISRVTVMAVDDSRNLVTLLVKDQSNSTVPSAMDTAAELRSAYIFAPGGYGNSWTGVESWLKDSGTLWNSSGLNLDAWPEFKSYVKTSIGTLTLQKLLNYMARYSRQMARTGHMIDTFITSPEVLNDFFANYQAAMVWDRGGGAFTVNDGFDGGVTLNLGGKMVTFETSKFIALGKAYGLKRGDGNLVRYVPPRPAGVQSSAEGVPPFPFQEIEIVSGLFFPGGGGWAPKIGSSRGMHKNTMYVTAESRTNTLPRNPSGMRLEGITYDSIVSE